MACRLAQPTILLDGYFGFHMLVMCKMFLIAGFMSFTWFIFQVSFQIPSLLDDV